MLAYLIVTSILGLIALCVGIGTMAINYEFGTDDEDFKLGAITATAGLFAPLTIPLVLLGGIVWAVYTTYNIFKEALNGNRD